MYSYFSKYQKNLKLPNSERDVAMQIYSSIIITSQNVKLCDKNDGGGCRDRG